MWWFFLGVLFLVAIAAMLAGRIFSRTESLNYRLLEKKGAIEIRNYDAFILAQTSVENERKEAIREGFRIIAGYIFGKNSASKKIQMTVPVFQQREGQSWTIRFVMPRKYTLDTLPRPNSDRVHLVEKGSCCVAAIRFSGEPTTDELERHAALLIDFVQGRQLDALSTPLYVFYNPPWTLPALRRNEVWVKIGNYTELNS